MLAVTVGAKKYANIAVRYFRNYGYEKGNIYIGT